MSLLVKFFLQLRRAGINLYIELLSLFNLNSFVLSGILFFAGIFSAIPVTLWNVTFFIRYPLWIWKKLKHFLSKQPSFLKLFFFILSFNSVSLLFNIISGVGIILPYLVAAYLGLNVGIIGYKEGRGRGLFLMCFAPHAIFELPAAWLSLMSGMEIGKQIFAHQTTFGDLLGQNMIFFVLIIFPLLFIAALIESTLMRFASKFLQHTSPLSDIPFNTEQHNSCDQQ